MALYPMNCRFIKSIFEFSLILKDYKDNPKRQDAYIRAKRVFDLLDSVKEWSDEEVIPKDALIREYIGGSIYKY